MILPPSFFNSSTLVAARGLLGKFLVRKFRGNITKDMITEVEAYDGFNDRASHASGGLTSRNQIMFGKFGFWYVYFVYGMHWMLNIVTREKGYPAAVLIRGTSGVSGPARVTKYFKVGSQFNGRLAEVSSGLWIEDREIVIPPKEIKISSRIGVGSAGPIWSKKPWRFYLTSHF
jgi:DNA-3-methyladenine glycosylase